ncbi:hypothetical protein Tco_0823110 [Tanacetum coccineum]|uniref:Uncharacterized protein n=1 Tax=Tanacetum coccineum TaxID=301880 RepID=A0ABQ5AGY6_9ASTR
MGDENPIHTLRDYSKPSHEGYRNTIKLRVRNDMMAIDYATSRRLRKLRPKEAWKTIEDLVQYEKEEWNELIFFEKESPDYIDVTLEQELESMECRVEFLMRNEVLLEYEVRFTFPNRPYQEELEAQILKLIDDQEDQIRQLEKDMRKTKDTFMCLADSLIATLKPGDGVTTIKRWRHDIHGDGVRDSATTLGRGRQNKRLDNVQTINTLYPLRLDTPYQKSGKTDSIKLRKYILGCLPGSTFVYSEVFKLDLSSVLHLVLYFHLLMAMYSSLVPSEYREETLRAEESGKEKGKEIDGSSLVNMIEDEGDPRINEYILNQLVKPRIVDYVIKLEEEKAHRRGKVYNWKTATYGKIWYDEDIHDLRSVETEFPAIVFDDTFTSEVTLSCEPKVSPLDNNKINFRIPFEESDDEDYTVIYDKNSFSYNIIYVDDLKMDSENDNDKVNMPSFPSPEPTVSYFDDLDYFKDFEKKFPAIVYNDDLTSKLDFLSEPTLSPQHIDEFNLKDKTSLSECDEEEQNVLYFNDLFPFNVIYHDDSKSDKDNDDDKIDIKQSLGGNVINIDVGAYAQGTVYTTYSSNEYSVLNDWPTVINTAYPGE